MGKEKKLTKSVRKFIRQEKARIRREVLDIKKQKELIEELYKRFSKDQKEHGEQKVQKIS